MKNNKVYMDKDINRSEQNKKRTHSVKVLKKCYV